VTATYHTSLVTNHAIQINHGGLRENTNSEMPPWSRDAKEAMPANGDTDGTCTECWKAAQSDNLKQMWSIYRETGIFLSACHHGLVWWIVDMIESGEL
jgi:Kyakuja-Dileera-Zisupton transposase